MMFRALFAVFTWIGQSGILADLGQEGGVAPRCESRACNPRMGNLALGRVVLTQTVCGYNGTEPYCSDSEAPSSAEPCPPASCGECNAALPSHAHLAAAMADSSFRHPNTWWQSATGADSETLQLDLEAEFIFTHLIMVFRSPRPGAMVLERSQDFGQTWKTTQYYARNCSATFGLAEGTTVPGGSACTSKYSGAYPCTRGEVIYRALSQWESLDPYGAAGQEQLRVTNIRIRLLERQSCPCRAKRAASDTGPLSNQHFAIYDLIVKGSCFCNGHAEQCVPAPGYRPVRDRAIHVVHGKCVCRHNTAGVHCERCSPLYNDRPWQPADGLTGAPHECRKCKCNGHAQSCVFDWSVWRQSGQRSGGVCECLHNTEGRSCQSCMSGFYRDPQRPHTAQDSCQPCGCHPQGSIPFHLGEGSLCNPTNGDCVCKHGVGGAHCDRCMVGYWGFHDYGCRPCACAGDCDPFTGDCMFGSDLEVYNLDSNSSEPIFRADEHFSALHYSEKCECKENVLANSKLFCTMQFAYVLKVKILSAHDKGSHAEVEVKIQKVLSQNTKVKIQRGRATLYPESWTSRGCTCPILNPGGEYLVAGYADRKHNRLIVNMKSFVKPWRASLGRKVLMLLKRDCPW
ncbi:hypothetical protein DPEC_G00113350 [Dallia pectoralis]|uniref:Uncharacterized protein n=1 Tax=Dallia pectoralis TaxID=75939 RepID=A0ACC2GTP3_DALPE|nr:hypothetical protein DPEC_G00113350 [Dallia pectoralis]